MADAVDGMGRTVDLSGKSLNDLKAMIGSLMSGKVGESKPFNNASKTNDKLKDLVDELVKTSKNFKSQVDGIKDYVQTMKSILKSVKEGSKSGGDFESVTKSIVKALGKKDASKSTASLMTQIISTNKSIAREIKGLRNIMAPLAKAGLEKGSIYVHDIYVQELLRKIAQKQGVSGLDEIPNEFKRISDIIKA